MSILIKGMKMPKTGYVDVRLFSDGRATTQTGEHPFFREMDIVEAPTPHGRLIDADAFTKGECNNCDGACEALPCDCLNCKSGIRCDFMKDIADAPTIIPADKDTNVPNKKEGK